MPEYCVTGGTGFIAAYLVKSLLEKGHTVRTTVRDPGSCLGVKEMNNLNYHSRTILDPQNGVLIENEKLRGAQPIDVLQIRLATRNVEKVGFLWELSGAKERLKIFKADLMVEGSFDQSVQGVDGVFHTASPVLVPYDQNIQATLIDPCMKGTLNVLSSCTRASSVRRVVLTSSCSSIRYHDDVQQVSSLNESHWSDLEYCKCHSLWYAYAKTIAEKEAWRVAKESGIDLVVVNPSFAVGPLLAPQPTSTLLLILAIVKGLRGEYPNTTVGFVHIDDVVAAHLLAMEESKATGRLICSSSVAHWAEIIKMLRAKYPSYPFEDKCSSQKGDNNPHSMDSSKIIQLGLPRLKTLDQMFSDCIKSFQDKGFL